jgi:ubiquinone/menaquinone biosynthesis C-methylase UbiE
MIRKSLLLTPQSVIVDIGCGDATLLCLIAQEFKMQKSPKLIGILPTQEEVDRIKAHLASLGHPFNQIEIYLGHHEALGLESILADIVIANGSLLLLENTQRVSKALEEIKMIAKPEAMLYLGEIPAHDELKNRPYGDSILLWLLWVLKNQGIKAFGLRLSQTIRSIFSQEPFIIAPKTMFFAAPEVMEDLISAAQLQLLSHEPHTLVDENGIPEVCRARHNYLVKNALN